MVATIVLAIHYSSVHAEDGLIYVPVEPCRIVNTRKGVAQPVTKNNFSNFLVSGTAGELFDQGGQQAGGCPAPRKGQKPAAIAAYVVAVPASSSSGGGVLTAYPSDQPQPPVGAAATVNFEQGKVVGNTTIISLCTANDCPADGQFAILARDTDEHVIVDVQGYFYPTNDNGDCSSSDLAGNWQTFIAETSFGGASCKVQIDSAGTIQNGSCVATYGNTNSVSGTLKIDSNCEVTGNIAVYGANNEILAAKLSQDRNTLHGVITFPGVTTTITAVR